MVLHTLVSEETSNGKDAYKTEKKDADEASKLCPKGKKTQNIQI